MGESAEPNPWLSIWIHTRVTIRRILASDPTRQVWLLAALAGVAHGLGSASSDSMGDDLDLISIVFGAGLAGAFMGVLALWLGSLVVHWTGGRIGGRGTLVEVRCALAWSGVPSVWSLIPWAVGIALLGRAMFTTAGADFSDNGVLAVPALAVFASLMVIAVWQVFVSVKSLAEAQQFSAWRALANLILASVVLLLALFTLFFVVGMIVALIGDVA